MDSYRTRSISQLVSQLNSLGQDSVQLAPLLLLALHDRDLPGLTRLRHPNGQQLFSESTHPEKKYPYDQIAPNLRPQQLQSLFALFQRGFSVTVLLTQPKQAGKLETVWPLLEDLIFGEETQCGVSSIRLAEDGLWETLKGLKITEKDVSQKLPCYLLPKSRFAQIGGRMAKQGKSISITRFRALQNGRASANCLNVIVLPAEMHSQVQGRSFLPTVRNQLSQLSNCKKLSQNSPAARMLPATNILSSILLQQSATQVIHWLDQGSNSERQQRLHFYDRLKGVPVLLQLPQLQENIVLIDLPVEPIKKIAPKTERPTPLQSTEKSDDLEFCRTLERKTHRFSLKQEELFGERSVEDRSLGERSIQKAPEKIQPKGMSALTGRQSQQIAMLKAAHAVEISQYHQTIQTLNRKVAALNQQSGLTQIYAIHERELMTLQLKIRQLREDIAQLTRSPNDKSYKAMVRKLNEEVKQMESKQADRKVAQGRLAQLEREAQQWQAKYHQSQAVRAQLTQELQHLSKRLKLRDAEFEQLINTSNPIPPAGTPELEEIKLLIEGIKQGQEPSAGLLLRKTSNLFEDLAHSREQLLQCSDFLVQLLEQLQAKVGPINPLIVLDCNRFIRSFLLESLSNF